MVCRTKHCYFEHPHFWMLQLFWGLWLGCYFVAWVSFFQNFSMVMPQLLLPWARWNNVGAQSRFGVLGNRDLRTRVSAETFWIWRKKEINQDCCVWNWLTCLAVSCHSFYYLRSNALSVCFNLILKTVERKESEDKHPHIGFHPLEEMSQQRQGRKMYFNAGMLNHLLSWQQRASHAANLW